MIEPGTIIENKKQHLSRVLTLRDLVLFNLVCVISITSLAIGAKAGVHGLTLFIIAAIFFFIPEGVAVNELSASYPEEGGIYFWTKKLLGKGHGFLCGWCYWVTNLLYFPTLVLTIGVIATYIFPQHPGWMEKKIFILPFSLLLLWIASFVNMIGMKRGKWLQNLGGVGTYLPFVILLGVGIYVMTTQSPANSFEAANWKLDFSNFSALNLWALIPFAYSGLELSSTMAGEIKDARRNLRLAVIIAAPLIALFYVIGSGALLYIIPHNEIDAVGGIFQAINKGLNLIDPNFLWLGIVAAVCTTIGRTGALGAWISGAARVALVVGIDKYLPKSFGKIHPRWKTPHVVILVQTIISTILLTIAILGKGTTVETAFFVLIDTSIIIYFIPYVYLFVCYLLNHFRNQQRTALGNLIHLLFGSSGIVITLFGIFVAIIPPPGAIAWTFELKIIGGCIMLMLAGGCFYWWREMKE